MEAFATIQEITDLFRALTPEETTRAEKLLPVVSDSIRQEAKKAGKDIDEMLRRGELLENVLKSVVVDVIGNRRTDVPDIPVSTGLFNVWHLSCTGRRTVYQTVGACPAGIEKAEIRGD